MEFKIIGDRTPESTSGPGLCATCSNAHIVNDEAVWCGASVYAPPIRIYRPVHKCNHYYDKRQPSVHALEKTAWVLTDDGHGHKKFCPPSNEKDR